MKITEQRVGDDVTLLRDLAARYVEVCAEPVQDERRALWRQHNSLVRTRPLIYVRAYAWSEMPHSRCQCADPFLRSYEDFFRRQLFWHSLNDDSIFEPWVTVHGHARLHGLGAIGRAHPQRRGARLVQDRLSHQRAVRQRQAARALARDRRAQDRRAGRAPDGRPRRPHHDQCRSRAGLSGLERRPLDRPGLFARHRALYARHDG